MKIMTKEEAIQILSTRDAHGVLCGYTSGVTKALDMAIEALLADVVSRENCDQCKIDQVGVLEQQLAELRGDYETLKKAYEEALSADAEWIPCSERLPNDAKDVLVCMRNGWIYMASYRHNRRLWKIDANGYANSEIVIAWMPLPKPYKGGDDE